MCQVNLTINPGQPLIQKQQGALNALAARSNPELDKWYHTTLFSPVRKTLPQAINKIHFSAYPNLTVDLINHLPPSMATAKGIMKQIQKNIKSTKTLETPPIEEEPMETLDTHSNHVFSNIIDPQQWIATDLSERLPVTSGRGNKYLFILY